jgi:hypothetical protein
MGPLRALHRADTVVKGVGTKLQATSARGDAMLRRVYLQLLHDFGNGRALENTRRDVNKDRFVHERIEAVVQRLDEPPKVRNGRGAA